MYLIFHQMQNTLAGVLALVSLDNTLYQVRVSRDNSIHIRRYSSGDWEHIATAPLGRLHITSEEIINAIHGQAIPGIPDEPDSDEAPEGEG